MPIIRTVTCAFVCFVFVSLSANASPLNAGNVPRWIDSFEAVAAWGEDNQDRFGDDEIFEPAPPAFNPMAPMPHIDVEKLRHPFSNAVKAARAEGLEPEFASVVRPHGFTPDQWGDVGDHVLRAYMALQMEGHGNIKEQLGAAISQMRAMGQEHFVSNIERSLSMIDALTDSTPEDMDLVRPHAGRMQSYFGSFGQ